VAVVPNHDPLFPVPGTTLPPRWFFSRASRAVQVIFFALFALTLVDPEKRSPNASAPLRWLLPNSCSANVQIEAADLDAPSRNIERMDIPTDPAPCRGVEDRVVVDKEDESRAKRLGFPGGVEVRSGRGRGGYGCCVGVEARGMSGRGWV